MGLTERSFLERMEEMGFTARKSNADRIRAMTNEELATIIFTGCVCTERFFKTESELLDWLKQEATE